MTSSLSSSVNDLVQQTLLGEVVENMGLALIAWNEVGEYLAANQEACRLTGYTRKQLLGLRFGVLTGASAQELAEAVSRAGELRGRSMLTRADATTVEVEWIAVRSQVAKLPAIASLFRAIS
jgi:PAS domain S-box-containing protein